MHVTDFIVRFRANFYAGIRFAGITTRMHNVIEYNYMYEYGEYKISISVEQPCVYINI